MEYGTFVALEGWVALGLQPPNNDFEDDDAE